LYKQIKTLVFLPDILDTNVVAIFNFYLLFYASQQLTTLQASAMSWLSLHCSLPLSLS